MSTDIKIKNRSKRMSMWLQGAKFLKPNKGLQDIFVNNLCIGYVITENKNLLSPAYERFWSNGLSESPAARDPSPVYQRFWSNGLSEKQIKDNKQSLSKYDKCDTENEGYYQVSYMVDSDTCDSKEWNIRFREFCETIYNILINDKEYVQGNYNRQ